MKIKKDDIVQILLGKDRGKTGKVLRVLVKEGKVAVEGVNTYKRHVKKSGQMEGGILELSRPLDISNVGLVCSNCKKVSRIGYKVEGETKVRICKKCREAIK